MNCKDKHMMDLLIQDKEKKCREYRVVVDSGAVWVEDIMQDEEIYTFEQYGYEFILELFRYLGVQADMC